MFVAFARANCQLGAWRYERGGDLSELGRKDIRNRQQPMLFAETRELIVDDNRDDGDYVVVLDLETGDERGRVHSGAAQSSGMFFCPGWDRDVYYATLFGEVARIYVA